MTLNLEPLFVAIERAFIRTINILIDELDNQLKSKKWDWDGTITVRRSGEIVGSPRNIVDLGGLLRSLQVIEINKNFFEIVYDTVYASLVHEGYTTSTGKRKPARPWVEEALREIDIRAVFIAELSKELQ